MDYKESKKKAKKISVQYRAYCKSKNNHWKWNWRDTYAEAEADADRHRYGNNGKNQFHDIIIQEKVHNEAKIS